MVWRRRLHLNKRQRAAVRVELRLWLIQMNGGVGDYDDGVDRIIEAINRER